MSFHISLPNSCLQRPRVVSTTRNREERILVLVACFLLYYPFFVVVRCFIVKHPFLLHLEFLSETSRVLLDSMQLVIALLLHQFSRLYRCPNILCRDRRPITHPSKDTPNILIQFLGWSKLYNPPSIHHTSTPRVNKISQPTFPLSTKHTHIRSYPKIVLNRCATQTSVTPPNSLVIVA